MEQVVIRCLPKSLLGRGEQDELQTNTGLFVSVRPLVKQVRSGSPQKKSLEL